MIRLAWATLAAIAYLSESAADAADWPNRTISILVPYAAGGQTDVVGRGLAERLSGILGQQVIVENLGGAGGTLAAQKVAKAPPDGYLAVIGNSGTHAFSQSRVERRIYNAETDFSPVSLITQGSYVLVARNDLPVNTLQDFIVYARSNQANMRFGSAGAGAGTHVVCALLNSSIGVNVTHVPYRGTAPAQQDLMGGRIDYMCDSLSTAQPQILGKSLKALALLGHQRSRALPDVATSAEQGLPEFTAENWNALFFPKGTPNEIVLKFNEAVSVALDSIQLKNRLETIGVNVVRSEQRGPEVLRRFVTSEVARWTPVLKALNSSSN